MSGQVHRVNIAVVVGVEAGVVHVVIAAATAVVVIIVVAIAATVVVVIVFVVSMMKTILVGSWVWMLVLLNFLPLNTQLHILSSLYDCVSGFGYCDCCWCCWCWCCLLLFVIICYYLLLFV